MSALFQRADVQPDETEPGIHLWSIALSLSIWTAMQRRERVTVAEAMLAFNTTSDVIRDAADTVSFVSIDGATSDPEQQFLQTDGE